MLRNKKLKTTFIVFMLLTSVEVLANYSIGEKIEFILPEECDFGLHFLVKVSVLENGRKIRDSVFSFSSTIHDKQRNSLAFIQKDNILELKQSGTRNNSYSIPILNDKSIKDRYSFQVQIFEINHLNYESYRSNMDSIDYLDDSDGDVYSRYTEGHKASMKSLQIKVNEMLSDKKNIIIFSSELVNAPETNLPGLRASTEDDIESLIIFLDSENKHDLQEFKLDQINRSLLVAARQGNLKIVELLIKNNADVNYCQYDGNRPLLEAAGSGSLDTVRKLVLSGAKLNVITQGCQSALRKAIRSGHIEIVKYLINSGETIDEEDLGDVLDDVTEHNFEMLQFLLEKTDMDFDFGFVLDIAASSMNPKLVSYVISRGATVKDYVMTNEFERYFINQDPDERSDYESFFGVASLLIKNGLDVNRDYDMDVDHGRRSLLSIAASRGSVKDVKNLIEQGANVNYTNGNSRTPLMSAVFDEENYKRAEGRLAVVKVLLENQANIDIRDTNEDTALTLVAKSSEAEDILIFKFLINSGAVVTHADYQGFDETHKQIYIESRNSVKLEKKSVLQKRKKPRSDKSYNYHALKMLFDKGISKVRTNAIVNHIRTNNIDPRNVFIDRHGNKANILMLACIQGDYDLVEQIINQWPVLVNFDVHRVNALNYAINCRSIEARDRIIKLLIEKGVSITSGCLNDAQRILHGQEILESILNKAAADFLV